MNFEVASALDIQLRAIVEHANQALFIVNNCDDDELRKKTQIALGTAIGEIDLQVWEKIYAEHPVLRPPEMVAISNSD